MTILCNCCAYFGISHLEEGEVDSDKSSSKISHLVTQLQLVEEADGIVPAHHQPSCNSHFLQQIFLHFFLSQLINVSEQDAHFKQQVLCIYGISLQLYFPLVTMSTFCIIIRKRDHQKFLNFLPAIVNVDQFLHELLCIRALW